MGGGNKTLEMTIAQQLMEWFPLFNPSAQKDVFRSAVLAVTDDPARAERLVPDEPHISDSIHDTELAFGTLMGGSAVTPKPGLNAVEVAGKTIQLMQAKVQEIMQQGGVGTPADVKGLAMANQYAEAFLKMLEQDEKSKPITKRMGQALGKIMNEVRAMAQRQQKAQEAAAQQNGQPHLDPKDAAKIQATQLTAAQKVQQMRESHAARTVERQIAFEQKTRQDQQKHEADMQQEAAHTALDLHSEVAKSRIKSTEE
jgi:hypothetical protein